MKEEQRKNITAGNLLSLLKERGVNCCLESPFEFLYPLTRERSRILCVEHPSPSGPIGSSSGISFWIHAGAGLVFIGLWSGILFRVFDVPRTSELVTDLLSGKFIQKGVTPRTLPRGIARKYNLRKCDVLTIWPENDADRIEDLKLPAIESHFTLSKFFEAIAPRVDSCRQAGEFVEIRIGSACALARFHLSEGETQREICVLVYDGLAETEDHSRLLRTLSDSLPCAMYDLSWNNRIHLEDPYYGQPSPRSRPSEPRNAFVR